MKKINKIFTLCCAALFVLFTGCENNTPKTNGIEVNGNISIENAQTGRSAFTSFPEEIEWTVKAMTSGLDPVLAPVTGNSFTCTLPQAGSWSFMAIGWLGGVTTGEQVLRSTTVSLEITAGGTNYIPLTAEPVTAVDLPGSISLVIKDESNLAEKVTMSGTGRTLDATGAAANSFTASATFSNGTATVSKTNLAPDSYFVKITFGNAADGIIYTCYEDITIYPGFTTDTWYGGSPYLTAKTDGSSEFTLKDTALSNYYTTPTMVYSYDYHSYSISLLNRGTTTEVTPSTTEDDSYPIDYCVDGNGYVYILYYHVDEEQNEPVIFSNNPTFANSVVSLKERENVYINLEGIAYDYATKKIYGYWVNRETLEIYCFQDLITKGTKSNYKKYTVEGYYTNEITAEIKAFAVNNNVGYIAKEITSNVGGDIQTLSLVKLSLKTDESITEDTTTFSEVSFDKDKDAIRDMIYMDGYLYLLVSNYWPALADTKLNYSYTGGIIRVKLDNVEIEKKFFSSERDIRIKHLSGNESLMGSFTIDQPDSLYSADGFFGPTRIIGIKPKKLIIADDGLFYYNDDENNLLFGNANRIVTVDLDSFEIENVAFTDETFEGDETYSFDIATGYESATYENQ